MKYVAALVLVPIATVFVLRSTVHAQPTKSVWDGIYTEEQAKRGGPLYSEQCASCHGPELMGGEMAPPLASGDFLSGWDGLTVGDLFERIRISMPQNAPGIAERPAERRHPGVHAQREQVSGGHGGNGHERDDAEGDQVRGQKTGPLDCVFDVGFPGLRGTPFFLHACCI
jgi:hypothetical protein